MPAQNVAVRSSSLHRSMIVSHVADRQRARRARAAALHAAIIGLRAAASHGRGCGPIGHVGERFANQSLSRGKRQIDRGRVRRQLRGRRRGCRSSSLKSGLQRLFGVEIDLVHLAIGL